MWRKGVTIQVVSGGIVFCIAYCQVAISGVQAFY